MYLGLIFVLVGCASTKQHKNKPYDYGWVPKKYEQIEKHYINYANKYGCQPGETIASIGAGNGLFELAVSCFVPDIHWYLQEIDTSRLYQFDQVLNHFTKLKGTQIEAAYDLVVGTPTSTNLPANSFDRILMINVYHEIQDVAPIIDDARKCLKPDGELVIMERMGDKPGQIHGDCKFPKLHEPDFLAEMRSFGFENVNIEMGEKVSVLKIYTFKNDPLQ